MKAILKSPLIGGILKVIEPQVGIPYDVIEESICDRFNDERNGKPIIRLKKFPGFWYFKRDFTINN